MEMNLQFPLHGEEIVQEDINQDLPNTYYETRSKKNPN